MQNSILYRLAEEAKQLAAQTSKYNIIVGSFITPEYANGHAEAYRMQGYDTKVIKMEGTDLNLFPLNPIRVSGKLFQDFSSSRILLRLMPGCISEK